MVFIACPAAGAPTRFWLPPPPCGDLLLPHVGFAAHVLRPTAPICNPKKAPTRVPVALVNRPTIATTSEEVATFVPVQATRKTASMAARANPKIDSQKAWWMRSLSLSVDLSAIESFSIRFWKNVAVERSAASSVSWSKCAFRALPESFIRGKRGIQ
jgi:hypothetical protein